MSKELIDLKTVLRHLYKVLLFQPLLFSQYSSPASGNFCHCISHRDRCIIRQISAISVRRSEAGLHCFTKSSISCLLQGLFGEGAPSRKISSGSWAHISNSCWLWRMLTCVLSAGSGVQCARHSPRPLACNGGSLVQWEGPYLCSQNTGFEYLPHRFFEVILIRS